MTAIKAVLMTAVIVVVSILTSCGIDKDVVDENEQAIQHVESVLELHKTAKNKLQEIRSKNTDIEIISQQLSTWLRTLSNVKEVNNEGNEICIVHSSGIESYILVLGQNDDANMLTRGGVSTTIYDPITMPQSPVKNYSTSRDSDNDNIIQNKDVLIWAPFQHQFGLAEYPVLRQILEASEIGFSLPIYYHDIDCTIASLSRELTNYGIVLLITHGLNYADGFFTGEIVPSSKVNEKDASDIFSKKLYTAGTINSPNGSSTYWVIRPNFIRALNGTFPKSIIMNNSCHSAANKDRLPEAFFSKGARTYLGYSNIVNTVIAVNKTSEFFTALTGSGLKKTGDAYIPHYYFSIGNVLCSYLMYGSTEMRFHREFGIKIVSGDGQQYNMSSHDAVVLDIFDINTNKVFTTNAHVRNETGFNECIIDNKFLLKFNCEKGYLYQLYAFQGVGHSLYLDFGIPPPPTGATFYETYFHVEAFDLETNQPLIGSPLTIRAYYIDN